MIHRFFTRSLVWLLVSLLVFSILPQDILAAEDTSKEQEQILIQVAADVEVYDNEGYKLGQLNRDTYLFTSSLPLNEEGNAILQWGDKEAIVDSESLMEAKVLVNLQDYNSFDETLKLGILRADKEPIPFKDETGNVAGSIAPGNDLPVSKLDDQYFYILVGGREFIVEREQFESSYIANEISEGQPEDPVLEEVEKQEENKGSLEPDSTDQVDTEKQLLDENTEQENILDENNLVENAVEESTAEEKSITEDSEIEETTNAESQEETETVFLAKSVVAFTEDTKYFKVTADQVPVYDNRSSSLVIVGYLKKGEVYPRTNDYTSWHQIAFGDYYAYVPKDGTIPSEPLIQNEYGSSGLVTGTRTFTALSNVIVYDNSSGSLAPFATILAGVEHTILNEYTSWYSVLVSGRVGYVRKSEVKTNFLETDKFFKVTEDRVPVYDNSSGELVEIGYLKAGESYPRIKHYTNWHSIKFGNVTGFVRSSSTTPDNGKNITNLGNGITTNVTISPRWDSVVYDNTQSSKLIPFAVVKKNTTFKIVKEYTSWYSIEVAGRIGFINKNNAVKPFTSTDKYFKALEENIPVYDNRSGTLVKVGMLTKGQVYPRTANYTSWHQIQFGDFKAYVPKTDTAPDSGSSIKNLNTSYKNTTKTFVALKNLDVMDNTTTPMTKFAEIEEGQSYPIVSESINWWGILFAGRIGYVKKDYALGGIYKEVTYTNYNYTLDYMVDKQMKVNPQTDKYKIQYAYVAGYLVSPESGSSFPTTATVTGSTGVNLRSEPNSLSSTWIYNSVPFGKTLTIVGDAGNGWYKVEYPTHIFGGFSAAHESDIREYVNPANFDLSTKSMYQFVLLSKYAGANPSELNKLLVGKGILEGKGEAFAEGSKLAGINEIYLVSHALLETGNGKSTLANGVDYKAPDGKTYTVYNMFGINANDGNATENASEFAFMEKWFTPEAAIIGGAKFVAERYVYNGYNQDTLYKMRWNPANPATHQYATDVGWAEKQTTNFMNLYNQLTSYQLYLDIPKFQ
ncbi:MAG: glucosaminidase domain-containing protein [Bacillota bacterium]